MACKLKLYKGITNEWLLDKQQVETLVQRNNCQSGQFECITSHKDTAGCSIYKANYMNTWGLWQYNERYTHHTVLEGETLCKSIKHLVQLYCILIYCMSQTLSFLTGDLHITVNWNFNCFNHLCMALRMIFHVCIFY